MNVKRPVNFLRSAALPKLATIILLILVSAMVLWQSPNVFVMSRGTHKRFSLNTSSPITTVFMITMENRSWSQIYGSKFAPYINKTLLPMGSYATQYYTSPGNHPSLPNYLWQEAGTNFGIKADGLPSQYHQSTTNHLVTLLGNAGYSWKAYIEGISGTTCPLTASGLYVPRHNGTLFFDDVTGTNDPNSAYCISHERPYTELAQDLQNNAISNYNYIEPNLCDDMHSTKGCKSKNEIANGDKWLSTAIPPILQSQAYKNGGVIFITWDEGTNDSDGPIGMIALSPYAKGTGYSNSIYYTHSSTLLTIEEIFGLTPLLGDVANATDLSDLFVTTTPTPTPTDTTTPTVTPSPTDTTTPTVTPSPTDTTTPTS